jgi:hypothetical protein
MGKALNSLRNNLDRPEQLRRACLALGRLLESQSIDANLSVSTLGIVETLMAVMRRQAAHADVLRDAAMVLQHLARCCAADPSAHEFILNTGVVGLLCTAMRTHDTHTLVQHYCCGVLLNLASTASIRTSLGKYPGVIPALVAAMQSQAVHAGVQQNASGTLMYLTHQSVEFRAAAVEAGAIEALIDGMRRHPRQEYVAQNTCGALQNITLSVVDYQAQAVRGMAVQCVVTIMQAHFDRLNVLQCACGVLRNLTGYPDGRLCAMDAGAMSAIVSSMRRHFDRPLHQYCCECLQHITSHPDSHDLAAQSGVIEIVIASLIALTGSPGIQQYGCGALLQVAYNNAAARARAADAGAIEAALNALVSHPTAPNLQQNALGCLLNLLKHPPTVGRAIVANSFAIVRDTMSGHLTHQPIQQYGCEALHKLSEHTAFQLSPTDLEVVVGCLATAMTQHPCFGPVQTSACETLFKLATIHPPEEAPPSALVRAIDPLIAAIRGTYTSPVVQQCAIGTLAQMLVDPQQRQAAIDHSAIESLIESILVQPSNTQVVQHACSCLHILISVFPTGAPLLVSELSDKSSEGAAAAVAGAAPDIVTEQIEIPEVVRAVKAGAMRALSEVMMHLENCLDLEESKHIMLSCLGSLRPLAAASSSDEDLRITAKSTCQAMWLYQDDVAVLESGCRVLGVILCGRRSVELLTKCVEAGVLQALSNAIIVARKESNVAVQSYAAMALVRLSAQPELRQSLVDADMIRVVVDTLVAFPGHSCLQHCLSFILANLARSHSLRPRLGQEEVFPALLISLLSTCACESCISKTNPEHLVQRHNCQLPFPPIAPSSSPARVVVLDPHALTAIKLLLEECPSNVPLACEARIIQAMVFSLRRPELSLDSLRSCSRVLFLLSNDRTACRLMLEIGVFQTIVDWITVNNDDIDLTILMFRVLMHFRDMDLRRSAFRLLATLMSARAPHPRLADVARSLISLQHSAECGCPHRPPADFLLNTVSETEAPAPAVAAVAEVAEAAASSDSGEFTESNALCCPPKANASPSTAAPVCKFFFTFYALFGLTPLPRTDTAIGELLSNACDVPVLTYEVPQVPLPSRSGGTFYIPTALIVSEQADEAGPVASAPEDSATGDTTSGASGSGSGSGSGSECSGVAPHGEHKANGVSDVAITSSDSKPSCHPGQPAAADEAAAQVPSA